MPDVKIKGYSGSEMHYADVPKVWLSAPESTEDNPVLVPFTYGEAMDGVEIIPDFSDGDMQEFFPDGYLARSAVVKRPETLVPENVAKGVDIAGIIGTLSAGKNIKIATGTVSSGTTTATISHNLGVIPDIIMCGIFNAYAANHLRYSLAFSKAFSNLLGLNGFTCFVFINSSSSFQTFIDTRATYAADGTLGSIGLANETTFTIGAGSGRDYTVPSDGKWYAIGGLT